MLKECYVLMIEDELAPLGPVALPHHVFAKRDGDALTLDLVRLREVIEELLKEGGLGFTTTKEQFDFVNLLWEQGFAHRDNLWLEIHRVKLSVDIGD